MEEPQVFEHLREGTNTEVAVIRCPTCGIVGEIDEEQYRGEVSIDCPNCDYHETHDLS